MQNGQMNAAAAQMAEPVKCAPTSRVAVVSPQPERLGALVGAIAADCRDMLMFRRIASLTEYGAGIDVYLFDLASPDLYGEFDAIRAFAAAPAIAERAVFLCAAAGERPLSDAGLPSASRRLSWPCDPAEAVRAERPAMRPPGGRHDGSAGPAASAVMRFRDLQIDTRRMSVLQAGRTLELTKTEYGLLLLLLQADGAVLTREALLDRIWGDSFAGGSNVIDVHVRGLRRKLGDRAVSSRYIVTVRGVGYRLAEER